MQCCCLHSWSTVTTCYLPVCIMFSNVISYACCRVLCKAWFCHMFRLWPAYSSASIPVESMGHMVQRLMPTAVCEHATHLASFLLPKQALSALPHSRFTQLARTCSSKSQQSLSIQSINSYNLMNSSHHCKLSHPPYSSKLLGVCYVIIARMACALSWSVQGLYCPPLCPPPPIPPDLQGKC